MPELPEVETVRRGLAPHMEGASFREVRLARPDLRFPFPPGFARKLKGRQVIALSRRSKYLLADLDDGHVVIMHLGMSGSFRVESDEGAAVPGAFVHERSTHERHDHVVFTMAGKTGTVRIVYNDPRRFGFMDLAWRSTLDTHPRICNLGVEPTGNALDAAMLAQLLAGKATSLKAALLDQRLVAGIGNIYACEALWRARLSPWRVASSVVADDGAATEQCAALAKAIRETINDAIEAGGSTLRDHRQVDGALGYFQHSFAVYGREGEPCPRADCDGTVRREVQNGRSSFYCPSCQV